MSFTFSIKTLGCKANVYDSLVLEKELSEIGGLRDDESPQVFLLNSCTVTNGADKQCSKEVKQIRKKAPGAMTIITGCYAQVSEEKIKQSIDVDHVITNEKKKNLKKLIADKFSINLEIKNENENPSVNDDIYWGQLPVFTGKTRAFLKIQDGCDDRCTYCIIPYARGESRSVRLGSIIAEISRLHDLGVKEVVLTGINIADYGKEFGISIEDLLHSILTQTAIARIRLTSLDPSEISVRLLALMKENDRIMPHFHVSLQSANSRVLRAMKRTYRQKDVIKTLNSIHDLSSEIFVGMDIIAGFPSETDEEHQDTVMLLNDLPWTRLHVFPYSEREGTPALKIKGSVPMAIRKERAKELMALSFKRYEAFALKYIGKKLDRILFESPHEVAGDYYLVGHTPNYLRVMSRVPSRDKADAMQRLNLLGEANIVGLTPKPEQDWTLEGYF